MFKAASFKTYSAAAAAYVIMPVAVSIPEGSPNSTKDGHQSMPSHHTDGKCFVNPWPSFRDNPMSPTTLLNAYRDWRSKPIPAANLLPQVIRPDWGVPDRTTRTQEGTESQTTWAKEIKATWLGHACFLIEYPIPKSPAAIKDDQTLLTQPSQNREDTSAVRGPRVLFDPVFSNRCSPSQYIGPARVTQPPIELGELPHVDAVILSHNHYDHTDVTTLKHIYNSQPLGSVHFFAPLGNKKWFQNTIGVKGDHVTEMDWWEERDLEVTLPLQSSSATSKSPQRLEKGLSIKGSLDETSRSESGTQPTIISKLRITCTPCQHFTGRSINDRFHTLWASWAVSILDPASNFKKRAAGGNIWFAGDTGLKSVPRGYKIEDEVNLPSCPAFKEIGTKFGSFDFAMIPIGAYLPRWLMAGVHCSPEDAVQLHLDVKSKRSVGMHWGTWMLTSEEMTEPPKRLKEACHNRGVPAGQFGVCDIGETIRIPVTPSSSASSVEHDNIGSDSKL